MKLLSCIGILNNSVICTTNSLFLKKFIEHGFASSFFKKGIKAPLRLSCIFKNPEDKQEAFFYFLEIKTRILRTIHNDYWIFHASAFSQDGQATMVLGDAGSGKSSLCFAAGLCGAKIISDEPVLVDKKSCLVIPFSYLVKVSGFYKNFSKWNFSFKVNLNRNRLIKKDWFDFNLFTKEDLNKLGIKVEDRKVPLKNIIFLEDKRCDSVIQLSKHRLNEGRNLKDYLGSLNSLIHKRSVKFLPNITRILRDEKKTKSILNEIIYS